MALSLIGVFVVSLLAAGAAILTGGATDPAGLLTPPEDAGAVEGAQFMAGLAVSLGALALPFLATARLVYQRPLPSFLWPGRRFDLRLFAAGAGVMLACVLALSLVGPWFGAATEGGGADAPLFGGDPPGDKALYVAAAIVGLLVAALAEEAVFRGALLQATAGLLRQPIALCLLNGLLFAAIHLDPDPVAFAARTASGAVWAWAALRLGGLEYALGGHWAGNLSLALVSDFTRTAQVDQGYDAAALVANLSVSLVALAGAEALARRRDQDQANSSRPSPMR